MADGIHTEVVSAAHAYTRSKVPWTMDEDISVRGRLTHYLSGGGMRTFGRTVRQEEVRRRRRRFCMEAAAFAVIWLVLLVI